MIIFIVYTSRQSHRLASEELEAQAMQEYR
jgi:hypothetical protein